MALNHELHKVTQNYKNWLERKFFAKKSIPCKLKLYTTPLPKQKNTTLPHVPLVKASPPPNLREKVHQKPQKLETKAPEKPQQPLPDVKQELASKFISLKNEYAAAYPQVPMVDTILDDTQAIQAIERVSATPHTSFYFFCKSDEASSPFYIEMLKALNNLNIVSVLHSEEELKELSYASIPNTLKAIFIPSNFFQPKELQEFQKSPSSPLRKIHGVNAFPLFSSEAYTSAPQNKAILWKVIKSQSS